ncbi:lysozyme inhibitor LprI family protein [Achromobacter deleyi]|nr:lysozyme inhibitor LprI family protein [Achromobacter deleyi]
MFIQLALLKAYAWVVACHGFKEYRSQKLHNLPTNGRIGRWSPLSVAADYSGVMDVRNPVLAAIPAGIMEGWRRQRAQGRHTILHAVICAVLASVPFLPVETAHAVGFDCKAAKTHVEHLICADPALSRLDDQTKALYDRIQAETAGRDGETGEWRDPVAKEQTQWRTTVRDRCTDAACLKSAYEDRIAAMKKNWAEALGPAGE